MVRHSTIDLVPQFGLQAVRTGDCATPVDAHRGVSGASAGAPDEPAVRHHVSGLREARPDHHLSRRCPPGAQEEVQPVLRGAGAAAAAAE